MDRDAAAMSERGFNAFSWRSSHDALLWNTFMQKEGAENDSLRLTRSKEHWWLRDGNHIHLKLLGNGFLHHSSWKSNDSYFPQGLKYNFPCLKDSMQISLQDRDEEPGWAFSQNRERELWPIWKVIFRSNSSGQMEHWQHDWGVSLNWSGTGYRSEEMGKMLWPSATARSSRAQGRKWPGDLPWATAAGWNSVVHSTPLPELLAACQRPPYGLQRRRLSHFFSLITPLDSPLTRHTQFLKPFTLLTHLGPALQPHREFPVPNDRKKKVKPALQMTLHHLIVWAHRGWLYSQGWPWESGEVKFPCGQEFEQGT